MKETIVPGLPTSAQVPTAEVGSDDRSPRPGHHVNWKSKTSIIGLVLAPLLLAACGNDAPQSSGSTASPNPPSVSDELSASNTSPSPNPTPTPSQTPTPSPEPTLLTGKALRAALLKPKDLGDGWRVKTRQVKASDDANDDDLSPECLDFAQFWFGGEISKNQPDAAYVELAKGKDLGERTVSVRIEPMPAEGWEVYRAQAAGLVEECPSISTASEGENSLPVSMLNEPYSVPGFDDAVGYIGSINAFIFQIYSFTAIVPIGDQIVTVTTTWSQKSKKEFSRIFALATDKVSQTLSLTPSTTPGSAPAPSPS